MYNIRDAALAPQGREKIEWVREHMPVLNHTRSVFLKERPFENERVAICLHLEAKTAYMALVFQELGADVYISGSNPLSTDDAVCAALAEEGIHVYSRYGIDSESYHRNLTTILDAAPTLIVDDGLDLTSLLHAQKRPPVKGACEETTTGIIRARALETQGLLTFPVIAVNDAYCKSLFDNRYGTGQSALDGIMRTTNLVIAGKTVVISGYGWVGKGLAMRARGLGAHVIVTEVDPIKALEAHMEGYLVMSMDEASRRGDIFITATGNIDVIREEHFRVMKHRAVLCNAGHFDVEIDVKTLRTLAQGRTLRKNVEAYSINGKTLYLLGEGRLVNLACADGHPAEIMDLSFALQVLSAQYVATHTLEPAVIPVPEEIDNTVANLALKALKITIDTLTGPQEEYLTSWKYGT
ncbi:MAG: adenosylhomocysteinase [Theionarchaea archaeon]|nr:adenosylhomocysteinase [Theionarchaea archaeon]